MLNKDKLNRVKGILSAKEGTLVPKYDSGNILKYRNKGTKLSLDNFLALYNDEYEELRSLLPFHDYNEYVSWYDKESKTKIQEAADNIIHNDWTKIVNNTLYKGLNSPAEQAEIQRENSSETAAQVLENAAATLATNNPNNPNFATYVKNTADKFKGNSGVTSVVQTPEIEKGKIKGKLPEELAKGVEEVKTHQNFVKIGELPEIKAGVIGDLGIVKEPTEVDITKLKADEAAKAEKARLEALKDKQNKFNGISNAAAGAAAGIDIASNVFVDKSEFADDDPTLGKGREIYDSVANSLMAFSPIGTIAGGAMKAVGLANDILGSKADTFAIDLETMSLVGGSYGGASLDLEDAASKSGKKYGLFSFGAKGKANSAIEKAKLTLAKMAGIAEEAADRRASSSDRIIQLQSLAYERNLTGGYDLRYLRAAKKGTKIKYFKDPFKVLLSDINKFEIKLEDAPSILKTGGTILDKLVEKSSVEFKIILSDPNAAESFKQGGAIKDREIEVIETNTTLKSVIPEGALHKNKHHLDEVGIDDSELTKKGIPVVDNDGDQQAEIELNEIIFTLEVTKEIESRYKEFYEEGTSKEKLDELAIEAGKLLWKEILYNTDDRTGLIDTLKLGGTIQKDPRKPAYKEWVKDINPDFLNEYYDLETAYKYLPYELLLRWKMAVNSENPDYYLNYLDPKTGEYIYHLGSIAPYGNGDYIFLKKGREKDNPELHWETDTYHDGSNGLKETHDLIYDKEAGRYFYRKKKTTLKHLFGGTITQDEINQMVKQALLNLLT